MFLFSLAGTIEAYLNHIGGADPVREERQVMGEREDGGNGLDSTSGGLALDGGQECFFHCARRESRSMSLVTGGFMVGGGKPRE